MAWTIRKPIRSKHLRAKYKDVTQAYANLVAAYKELYEKHFGNGELIKRPTQDQVAKVSMGGELK